MKSTDNYYDLPPTCRDSLADDPTCADSDNDYDPDMQADRDDYYTAEDWLGERERD